MTNPINHILIAGDSTAADYAAQYYPMMGWGQSLRYFALMPAAVLNFAQGGRSSRSFREEGHWDALMAALTPGDLVFIQFGHNDQKRDCPSLYAPPDRFIELLSAMVDEVRSMKGHPVLLTSFPRCLFGADGRLTNTHGEYPQATREAAARTACPLLDVNQLAHRRFVNPVKAYGYYTYPSPGSGGFAEGVQDISHFNIYGAHEMAKMVVDEFIRQELDSTGWFIRKKNKRHNEG